MISHFDMLRRPVGPWIIFYLILLLPTLLVAAFVWQEYVSGNLYYCSDSLPWEFFCPGPFAHLQTAGHGQTGDYYVASEETLQRLRWGILVAAAVFPALLVWFFSKILRNPPRRAPSPL